MTQALENTVMEEPSPVAKHTEQSQKDLGTFDERWDRYCRLRDTACQLFIYGQFDSSALTPAPAAQRATNAPGQVVGGEEVSDGLVAPQADRWLISCEADMAAAVECTAAIDNIPRPAAPTASPPAAEATVAESQPVPATEDKAANDVAADKPADAATAGTSWRLDASHQAAPAPHRPKLAFGTPQPVAGEPAAHAWSYRVDAGPEAISAPHFTTAGVASGGTPLYPIEDAYRQLRDRLFPSNNERPQALAWLGAQSVEESASVVTALAKALAERGPANRVLLVDADFEAFSLSRRFKRPGSAGLGDVVAGKRPWRNVVLPTALAQIDILPCGSLCDRPLATLNGAYWTRLLEELKESYRFILIDAGTADQPGLAPLLQVVDATYMLVEFDRTTRAEVAASVAQLRRWGVANLATVMVGIPANELVA